MKISIIVATDSSGGIGKNGGLPWKCPADLQLFKERTMGHFVIVGRTTWEAMKTKLPGRNVIVLTSQPRYRSSKPVFGYSSCVQDAIEIAKSNHEREVFIIGGERVYNETLAVATTLYITRISGNYSCDKFFPSIDPKIWYLDPRSVTALHDKDCVFYVCIYKRPG